jgi:hypothetical protein
MAEYCRNARFLVLHFVNGKLRSTKVTHSWRGAMLSKRNHEKGWEAACGYDLATRILPIEAILAIRGLERPDTDLSADDAALLRRMGIDL